MPRPETTTKTGRERLAEERARQARGERNRKIGIIAAVLVVLAAIGGGGWALLASENSSKQAATGDGLAGAKQVNTPIKGLYEWTGLGRNHITTAATYPMNPPVGGDHNAAWANCGIYDKVIPNQYAVHSLEHGAVWITTNDKASASDVAALKKIAGQDYMLMSKNPSQASPITLSAWGVQLRVNSAGDPRVQEFVKTYLQGQQTPEPGASCTGAYDPNTGKIGGGM